MITLKSSREIELMRHAGRVTAQARALELSDKIRDMASKPDARLQAYADMIKAAQDGGNLSLF